MKKSTSILLICGGIFAGLIFLKNGKNGLDKLKQFLQDLANGLGDLSKAIWDGIKNFWGNLKLKGNNTSFSNPFEKSTTAKSTGNEKINQETVGYYDEENDIWYPVSGHTEWEIKDGIREGRYIFND